MAIVMAAASTTRPASCPPIRRVFSGRVSDTLVALIALCPLAAAPADSLADGCGDTVGNSPAGLVPLPAGSGSGIGGSGGADAALGAGVVGVGDAGADTILNESAALNETAPGAFACAVSFRCRPGLAAWRTFTRTRSSSAWPRGRFPSAHVARSGLGQIVNRVFPRPLMRATLASTVTWLALARVVQTQTTYVAVPPGRTRAALVSGWTATHR
jgi:hypothetical protein